MADDAERLESIPDFMRKYYEDMSSGDIIDELWDHEDVAAKYRIMLLVFATRVEDAVSKGETSTLKNLCSEVRDELGD